MKKYEMTDLCLITYFLGIEFYKSKKGLNMHQRTYAFEILKKFEIKHCKVVVTPAKPRMQLSKDEHEYDVDPSQY